MNDEVPLLLKVFEKNLFRDTESSTCFLLFFLHKFHNEHLHKIFRSLKRTGIFSLNRTIFDNVWKKEKEDQKKLRNDDGTRDEPNSDSDSSEFYFF